ncbi:hypothetical protein, partial [Vibrio alginolyticus]|uniref:hypothetical protein n=1 Tax=Vibrio alginolyticus TaxID=663 RepID=UPI001981D4DC
SELPNTSASIFACMPKISRHIKRLGVNIADFSCGITRRSRRFETHWGFSAQIGTDLSEFILG